VRARVLLLLTAVALTTASIVSPSAAGSVSSVERVFGPGARAIPLRADTPAWFTPELAQRVHLAGAAGVPLPAGVAVPASSLAYPGIRPGAWMISPSWCTLNFVFGGPGNRHIGTAGHCANVGQRVVIVAAPGILMEIGTTVRSIDGGVGNDFALIRIDPGMQQHVRTTIAHVGGPKGTGTPRAGNGVLWSGHAVGIGTGGTPRAGVVTFRHALSGGEAYAWVGPSLVGDSGSAVRLGSGPAAGNLTHLVAGTLYRGGIVAGTTAKRIQQIAGMTIARG
jgi:hypothetical protein